MKIAFLNIYNGIVERGSEVFVHELANRLSQKHKVTVFQTGKGAESKYRTIQVKGIQLSREQGFLYDFFVFFFTLKCVSYLWKERFDWIIPVNGRGQTVLVRILRLFGVGKLLISGHAGVGFDDRFNILFGKPDVFIALSPEAYDWAKKISSSRVEYIPNGIDTDQFKPTVKRAHISLESPMILCVSALLSYKRIDRLIHAVKKLQKGSLLVIGDGQLKKEIEELGEVELKERFQLMPYVSHDELPSYYRAARVFSLPSRESEAFGLVYLEAMACNIPIVAPDDKNRKTIIGDGGLYCNVENVEEYANMLDRALKTDFKDAPRKQSEKFSWKHVAEQYEKVME